MGCSITDSVLITVSDFVTLVDVSVGDLSVDLSVEVHASREPTTKASVSNFETNLVSIKCRV